MLMTVYVIPLLLIELLLSFVFWWLGEPGLFEFVSLGLEGMVLLVAIALAWQKPLLTPFFWKGVFIFTLLWHSFFTQWSSLATGLNYGLFSGLVIGEFGLVFIALMLVLFEGLKVFLLYNYAFRSSHLWSV